MSAANSSDQKVRHLIPNAACCVKFGSRVSGALFDVQCHSARISPGLKLVLVWPVNLEPDKLCVSELNHESEVTPSSDHEFTWYVPDARAMFFAPVQYSKISRL